MKNNSIFIFLTISILIISCNSSKKEEKGFQVIKTNEENDEHINDLNKDSLKINTKPSNILLTGIPNIRIATIYKINYDKEKKTSFIGDNCYHKYFEEVIQNSGNNWHNNLMPGFEAVYGFNFVNIFHYNIKENAKKTFFEKPVLIKTLYYPSFTKDTLNFKAIQRNYFMVSVYNEDTNKDDYINLKDLRRFFLFNLNGEFLKLLVPENFSVFKSEYDPINDYMYVFTKLDKNNNGRIEEIEPTHIFWIDLKDPLKSGLMY